MELIRFLPTGSGMSMIGTGTMCRNVIAFLSCTTTGLSVNLFPFTITTAQDLTLLFSIQMILSLLVGPARKPRETREPDFGTASFTRKLARASSWFCASQNFLTAGASTQQVTFCGKYMPCFGF